MRSVQELIRQRRSQMLVHSYLYYWLDEPIVSDHDWQAWADELVALQAEHGTTWGWYDSAFADWTGATGAHLPKGAWVEQKARSVLAYHNARGQHGQG